MHLAAHRKNSALAFNRLVDLTECYARCRESETDAAVAALAKSDQSLSVEEPEDLPHHDRVGLEAFRDCLRSRPLVAAVSDETHEWMALARRLFVDIKRTVSVTVNTVKLGRYFCHRLICRCRRRPTENSCEPTSAQWNVVATAETDTRG